MENKSNQQQSKGENQPLNAPNPYQLPEPPYDPTPILEDENSNIQNTNTIYPPYSQPNTPYQPPTTNYQPPPTTNYQQNPNSNYQQPPNSNYQQTPSYQPPQHQQYPDNPQSPYYVQPPTYGEPPDYHYQPQPNYPLPEQEPFVEGPCTYNRTHKHSVRQPFYNCITCGLVDGLGCCEACARICHAGHQLVPRGYVECYCDCGCGKVSSCVQCRCMKVPASQAKLYEQYTQQQQIPQCTYLRTGRRMVNQRLCTCITCGFRDGTCICESCARVCHYGHDVRSLGVIAGYCDCGAGNLPGMCRCMNGTRCSHCYEEIVEPVYIDACNLQ